MMAGAGEHQRHTRPHPVAAPVHHDHAADRHVHAPDDLPGVEDGRVADQLQLGPVGHRARGHDHHVRRLALHQRGVHAGPGHDPHARPLGLALQVRHHAAELRSAGQLLGEQHLPADPARRLVEGDVVAALRRHRRGLEPGRSPAHDEHAPPIGFRNRTTPSVPELPPALRVLDAGDGVAGVEVPDAGLVAGDAGADLVQAPRRGLLRQQRVRDQGARHRDGVGLAQLQDVLRLLWLVDAPRDQDGDADPGARERRQRCGVRVRHRHRRHDVVRARQRRRGARWPR